MTGTTDLKYLLLVLLMSHTPYVAKTAVLDPALYLYPSPPLIPSSRSEIQELWTRNSRSTKLQNVRESTEESTETRTAPSTRTQQEPMETAETFWPRLRSIDYALKQVNIPVTFTLSGNYGGYRTSGVIGSSYASIGGSSLFGYGKSALAGSGYGNYGSSVRVYGGNDGPAWSGWGNGKWGHYGKG